MIAGTASHVGKSVLCAALCRILRQDGFRVAPFKAQNMALNSYPTRDGGEIGRAQVVQAQAAGLDPTVHMNPILLKPKKDMVAQVIVLGRPVADMSALAYREEYLPLALEVVKNSLDRLLSEYDVVVMEGAGSIAEVNLKDRDIVNLRAAALAQAPVVVVADIDRGGVFASIVGTMELLATHEREQVAGWIINKFRGDIRLLGSGLDFLEQRTGRPVLGVVPYLPDLGIEEEDSVTLSDAPGARARAGGNAEAVMGAERAAGGLCGQRGPFLQIVAPRLPRISNFTDFDALIREPDVRFRYADAPADLAGADALIIPGTKNTVDDLFWLREKGLADEIPRLADRGVSVVGICGGYQMLGEELRDPHGLESDQPRVAGLGLLGVTTTFAPGKTTVRARGQILTSQGFFGPLKGTWLAGYEIHAGHSTLGPGVSPLLRLAREGRAEDGRGGGGAANEAAGREVAQDGAVGRHGRIFGTYLHGLFDHDGFRRAWLNSLRARRGLVALPALTAAAGAKEAAFDRLAEAVRRHVRLDQVYRLLELQPGK